MFTGIIQHVGSLLRTQPTAAGRQLTVDLGPLAGDLALGDSVAVNGACLTATAIQGQAVTFDAVAETLRSTTLGDLAGGAKLNLERALPAAGRLEGHIVQGHVDAVARVHRVDRTAGQWMLHLSAEKELTDAMVPKGSVAIDGVSLTLADVADGRFAVAIIPATLQRTTLALLRPAQSVNIETDILGKYVLRMMGKLAGQGGLTIEALGRAGFA